MKTMKLLPLKIAVTSAMIVGLGMASTANAQQKPPKVETFLPNIFFNEYADDLDTLYHNMILGDTAITHDDQYKFYADDANEVPDSLFFNKILHDQLLHGFKKGDKIIPLDENGKPVYKLDERVENGVKKSVYSVTTKTATDDDVNSAYSRGIQGDIDDLYTANTENVNRLIEHGDKIFANEESVQYLNKEVQNNIEHIHELAQQQDQHSSDIKTLKKNVEEGLLELSGHLIDQKADLTKDIKTLESNVEEGLLELSGHLIDQKADLTKDIKTLESNVEEGLLELSGHLIDQKADLTKDIKTLESNVEEGLLELSGHLIDQKADLTKDIKTLESNVEEGLLELSGHLIDQKADIAQNQANIQDLAAYNELQDAYAKQQTEAIDALNKASSENTQNIAKNQADIANNINNIYELAQQQDQHSSDIKTLAKVSAANADRIAKNKADADASFETLTKNQNTLIEKDKEHDKLITANKTAIDANKASADTKFAATADAITKNGNAITKNAKSITDLGTKVDGFDGRVTALDTKVNAFDGRISALDTKVNAFDGRITALDSKVENGMAAQAALSGLFQPYSVGKFNATAALGGYGSKSAVAIGAGYRVNPNLAFKAGAAINTSGNKKGSYNIGVNYEF
ncbi:YadA-like family protein [Moraxella catarrhalis]|uniref:YadA-like family protein n=1 Tax=Moraxella catarrhalis TaxID=480 RepID=UPI000EA9FCB5|nr:YadA-like family protein [Moraxella catarrhalis]RKL94263.1 cell surface protein [Moraxella catarrhalis]RKL97849.1 cell surface protein [Moraxella catarrhalis]